MSAEDFTGHDGRECGEHRTTGQRAWCFCCTAWCSPEQPCAGCELPQLRARLAAAPTEPVGYMIVGPNCVGELEADWDGVVHPTVEAGQAELAKCREIYPSWFLCALVPQETP